MTYSIVAQPSFAWITAFLGIWHQSVQAVAILLTPFQTKSAYSNFTGFSSVDAQPKKQKIESKSFSLIYSFI